MSTRRDLAAAVYTTDKLIDAKSRAMQDAMGSAVRKHEGPMTPEAMVAIMQRVDDDVLPIMYPTTRGGHGWLQTMIEQRAALVARVPIVEQVALMRRVVPDDLLAAMGDKS